MSKKRKITPNPAKTNLAASGTANQLIVNQINIAPVRRGVLDVQEWRDALKQAESISGRRTKLYDLYADILLDTHLTSELEKRIMAITNSDIVFVNAKGEEVEEINTLIDTPEFEEVLTEIQNAKNWGITLLEFTPGIKIFQPNSIERRNIMPQKGLVVFDQYSDLGISYREGTYANWVVEIGKPKELGLLLKAAFWVIIKRGGIGDFAQFAELFGMPTRIAEYDVFDEATRIELEKAMKEAGSANYILKPKGTNVELLENNNNADGSLYEKLIGICDKAISVLLLGQTLTTIDKSGSGFAQATIHQETKDDIIKADKRFSRRILNNQIKRVLGNLGYPVQDGKFTFRDAVPITTRKAEVDLIKSLKDQGVPVDDDHVYKVSGVPKPEKYEELKKELDSKSQPPVPAPPTPPTPPAPEDKPAPEPGKKKPKDKKLTWDERMTQLYEKLIGFFHSALRMK